MTTPGHCLPVWLAWKQLMHQILSTFDGIKYGKRHRASESCKPTRTCVPTAHNLQPHSSGSVPSTSSLRATDLTNIIPYDKAFLEWAVQYQNFQCFTYALFQTLKQHNPWLTTSQLKEYLTLVCLTQKAIQNSNQPLNQKRLTKKLKIWELSQLITLYVMILGIFQVYTNQKT